VEEAILSHFFLKFGFDSILINHTRPARGKMSKFLGWAGLLVKKCQPITVPSLTCSMYKKFIQCNITSKPASW
jgi:hypothetical protein